VAAVPAIGSSSAWEAVEHVLTQVSLT